MRCLAAAFVLALSLTGCSKQPEHIAVSGWVTFHGQPLDQGFIEFAPLADTGLMSGAEIKEGHYSLPAEKGLSEGRYQVRISSSEGGAAAADEAPGDSTVTAKERIPAAFNSQSTQEVEVKKSAENKFDFQIP